VFGADGGEAADLAQPWLPLLGLATIALAAVGTLAARDMRGMVGYLVVASAGTLLTALGSAARDGGGGAVLSGQQHAGDRAALLLADRIGAQRGAHGDLLAPVHSEPSAACSAPLLRRRDRGVRLPPLAGFLGKSLLLAARCTPAMRRGCGRGAASGLAIIISLVRAGSRIFWRPYEPPAPSSPIATSSVHAMAVGWLFRALLLNTAAAGPLARYTAPRAAAVRAARLHRRRARRQAGAGGDPDPRDPRGKPVKEAP